MIKNKLYLSLLSIIIIFIGCKKRGDYSRKKSYNYYSIKDMKYILKNKYIYYHYIRIYELKKVIKKRKIKKKLKKKYYI